VGEIKKIKKAELDEILSNFPVGAVIEDYIDSTKEAFGTNIIGNNVQIVGVSVTIRGDNAQMDIAFKHPNYMEDEDDSDDEEDELTNEDKDL
jgi:hypothetical protein